MFKDILYDSQNYSPRARGTLTMEGVLLARRLLRLAVFLAGIGSFLLVVLYTPSIIYWFRSAEVAQNTNLLGSTTQTSEIELTKVKLPPEDPSLPKQNMLKIESIGVSSQINEAEEENYEEALQKGVWRVGDFATPEEGYPVILAAHRYGYLNWSPFFRRTNSFLNLPKTKIGDRIEIIWNQRKFVYQIYKEEEGSSITDYKVDLILYTCRDLSSPIRVFRYARLI